MSLGTMFSSSSCGQPASCTNASKHSLVAKTYIFSRNVHELP